MQETQQAQETSSPGNDPIKKVYDYMFKHNPGLGSEDEFRVRMQEKGNRDKVYTYMLGKAGAKLGNAQDFEQRITGALSQKKSPSPTGQDSSATSSTTPTGSETSKLETPSISSEQQAIDDQFSDGMKTFSRRALSRPAERYSTAESQIKEKYGPEAFDDLTKARIQAATFRKQIENAKTDDERTLAEDNLKGVANQFKDQINDPLFAELEDAGRQQHENFKEWHQELLDKKEDVEKNPEKYYPKKIVKWKETADKMSSFGDETDTGNVQQGAIFRGAAKFSNNLFQTANWLRSQFRSEDDVKKDPHFYDGFVDWLSKTGQNSVNNMNFVYPQKYGNESIFGNEKALVEKTTSTITDLGFIILGTKGLGAAGLGSKSAVVGSVASMTYADMLAAAEEAGLKDEAKHRFALSSSISVGLVNLIGGSQIEGGAIKEAVKSTLSKEAVKSALGSGSKEAVKIFGKQLLGEYAEELLLEPAAQGLNEILFNLTTESEFNPIDQFAQSGQELAEQMVLTTIASGPINSVRSKTKADKVTERFNYDAAKNFEKFSEIIDNVEADPAKKATYKARIEKLSKQLENAEIKDPKVERQVASDQDRVNAIDDKLKEDLDAGTTKALKAEKKELEENIFNSLYTEEIEKESKDPKPKAEENSDQDQQEVKKEEAAVEGEDTTPLQSDEGGVVESDPLNDPEKNADSGKDNLKDSDLDNKTEQDSSLEKGQKEPELSSEEGKKSEEPSSANPLMDRVNKKGRKQGKDFIGKFQERFNKDGRTPDDVEFQKDKKEFNSEVNRVSDEIIKDARAEMGDRDAYIQLRKEAKIALKEAVDDSPSASFAITTLQKIANRQFADGDTLGAIETSKVIKGAGSAAARTFISLQDKSSPEALVSAVVSNTIGKAEEFLNEEVDGKTNRKAIEDLQKKVAKLEKQLDVAKNDTTIKKRKKAKVKQQSAIDRIKEHFTDSSTGFAALPEQQAEKTVKLAKALKDLVASTVELGVIDIKDLTRKVTKTLRDNKIKNARKYADQAVKDYISEVQEDLNKIIGSFGDRMSQNKVDKLLDKLVSDLSADQFTSEVIREATGINYDKDAIENVQKIAAKIMSTDSTLRKNHYFDQLNAELDKIRQQSYGDIALDSIMEVYYLNMLSGVSTVERGAIGATVTSLMSALTNTIESPIGSFHALGHIFGNGAAGLTGLSEAKYIMNTGRSNFDYLDVTPNGQRRVAKVMNKAWSEYAKNVKKGNQIPKNVFESAFKLFWTIPNTMYRLLISFDPLVVHSKIEHNSFLEKYNDSLANGSSIAEAVKTAKQSMQYEKIPEFQEKAESELAEMEADGEKFKGYVRQRVKELLMKERGEEFSNQMMEDAREAVLMNNPKGTLGKAVKLLQAPVLEDDSARVKMSKIALRTIFPILRVPANFVNMALDYTPVGVVRNTVTRKADRDIEIRRRYYKVAQGAALFLGMAAMFLDWEDEWPKPKDNMRITGNGTRNWFDNQQIDESWKDMSIQWKVDKSKGWTKENTWSYRYTDNPIGIVLFGLGKYSDVHLLKDKKRMSNIQGLTSTSRFIALSSLEFGYQQTFAQGFKEVFDLASQAFNEDSDRFDKNLEKALSKRASTLTTPNIYKQLGDLYERMADVPEKDVDSWYENLYKDLPFANELLTDSKTDALGYPRIKEANKPKTLAGAQKIFEGEISTLEKRYAGWKIVRKYPSVRLTSKFPPRTGDGKSGSIVVFNSDQRKEMTEAYKAKLNQLLEKHKAKLLEMNEDQLSEALKDINRVAGTAWAPIQAKIEATK